MSTQSVHECRYGHIAARYCPASNQTTLQLSVKLQDQSVSPMMTNIRKAATGIDVPQLAPGLAVWAAREELNLLALTDAGKNIFATLVDSRYRLAAMEQLARENYQLFGTGGFSLCYVSERAPRLYSEVLNILGFADGRANPYHQELITIKGGLDSLI